MVTAVATFTTPFARSSYLTASEYRHAPTGVDTEDLVTQGTAEDEDSELANVIARASSYVDQYCNQVLAATVDIEAKTCWVNRQGRIVVHPDYWPIQEIRDFQYGTVPNNMVAVGDLTNIFIGKQLLYVDTVGMFSSIGPLSIGGPSMGSQIYVRYAYVNGWPNTILATAANAGDTVLNVTDATGVYGGTPTITSTAATPATVMAVYDGATTERSVSVASVAGNALTLNAPLVNSHPAGTQVSALPAAVRQATIFVTSALIKTRGNDAVVMNSLSSPSTISTQSGSGTEDLGLALSMLAPFRRVR